MVIPAAVRDAIVEHAEAEKPNEACGLIAIRSGIAQRYIPGRNTEPSSYHFHLEVEPDVWMDLWDDGFEVAIFHSHISSPPRPSRTDVENIGQWEGLPYVILNLRTGEFAAWRIRDGNVESEELSE